MKPDPDQNQRGLQVPTSRGQISPTSRQAAANLMRDQIDKIYDEPQPNEQLAAETSNSSHLYHMTHSEQADATAASEDKAVQAHWQKYHSAWQQYYQMYYERYYQAEVQKHLLSSATPSEKPEKRSTFPREADASLTEKQAVSELRSDLLRKVRAHSQKIRTSRHFMPAMVAVCVAVVFVFLQYNQLLVANVMAYTTPSSSESLNNYVNPSTDVSVGPAPLIKIPKIGVEAPVVYDLNTLVEDVVQTKLQNGVVHYPIPGANAMPGQVGNSVILGHSANDVFAAGNYKFIFLRLDRLEKDDKFYLNYQGKRYTYIVTEKKIISPNQVSELAINNGKPMATLVTCTPVGTSTNRLLIIGEQIAPDPAKATASTEPPASGQTSTDNIGGGTSSFFERLFGGH